MHFRCESCETTRTQQVRLIFLTPTWHLARRDLRNLFMRAHAHFPES